MDSNKEKIKYITRSRFINILFFLFLVSIMIGLTGSIVKGSLGEKYVFHSWVNLIYVFSWILAIGLIFIIPIVYSNNKLIFIFIIYMCIAIFYSYLGYHEENKSGEYIVQKIQGLGEKTIYYFEDINIFMMKEVYIKIVR
ncbi:Uncharacterised protein [[Clostridium] sordellii]|uniref:Uncharacterized protein n=1 Tax=Paraclostridium sordellii TaxID=1505 RepID=A0ABP1XSC8_PARSO|nr:hypothetical protein [Paeniclostridium sordellii]CEJ74079.1 hypothetical protein ATCC9714_19671 [[Clostridium] sordellii] [Paeniclostridium sordellii]CEN69624.1 Uncharacterised protein [[Clostridium] sordellii] [Paeniclostridium sordellii]CEN72892.1 Uncharacterised protein [[Clostridium] sordellii] [Paeniclostridium sordellii]CEO25131.1 Uncharacterised protein [[Clostridium] sordellii] [Paeniclostridium sordellii]CEP75515.1 Uncharacterised protein [[Clostridium] sordellii] [Paeniclostridium